MDCAFTLSVPMSVPCQRRLAHTVLTATSFPVPIWIPVRSRAKNEIDRRLGKSIIHMLL